MVRISIKKKYAAKPARPVKRRVIEDDTDSSSLDLSDDGGYSGVDDVSDSDDDDEDHVFAAEEEHIIKASRKRAMTPPRPLVEDDEDDADAESEADEEEDAESDAHDPADDSASWDGIGSDHDEPILTEPLTSEALERHTTPVERHVRFTGVPDSDSDSTTSETSDTIDHDFFPDIFVAQSALDPSFRREIEDDDETSSNGSFWDFHNASQELRTRGLEGEDSDRAEPFQMFGYPFTAQPAESSTAVAIPAETQELDGYETDGDTTEEDIPEPLVRRKTRRPHSVEPSSDSDTERPIRYRPGKPRVGRFNLDRSDNKPIGVVDPASGKMIIFTPRRTNHLDLSPESLHFALPGADLSAGSPLVRNPAYIMMGAMASPNPFGDFMNMQPYGPAEAFFPCSDAMNDEESDDSYFAGLQEEEEDEEESILKIEDFVTFNDESFDEEDESGAEWNGDFISSPTRPKTAASNTSAADAAAAHPLLTHFDNNPGIAGAFRRNQINQQLIYSEKASQESLAFSGPLYHGTLRGIKEGSMETVTTPITPIRRQKKGNLVSMNGLADIQQSSPLNILSQKRKASGTHDDENLHKRHRSISDMEVLQIS